MYIQITFIVWFTLIKTLESVDIYFLFTVDKYVYSYIVTSLYARSHADFIVFICICCEMVVATAGASYFALIRPIVCYSIYKDRFVHLPRLPHKYIQYVSVFLRCACMNMHGHPKKKKKKNSQYTYACMYVCRHATWLHCHIGNASTSSPLLLYPSDLLPQWDLLKLLCT